MGSGGVGGQGTDPHQGGHEQGSECIHSWVRSEWEGLSSDGTGCAQVQREDRPGTLKEPQSSMVGEEAGRVLKSLSKFTGSKSQQPYKDLILNSYKK